MKATLHFDLNKPEDRFDYNLTNKASDLARVVWEMGTNCRKSLEHELGEKKYNKYDAMNLVFSKFYELCNVHNINFNELCQ